MMNWVRRWMHVLFWAGLMLLAGACRSGTTPGDATEGQIATQVAIERAVAATLTAEAREAVEAAPTATPVPTGTSTPPASPTATSEPTAGPTATPTATPTPIRIADLPVEGATGDVESVSPSGGEQNVLLPGFDPNEVTDPMVFRGRIGMALAVYAVDADTQQSGTGIESVTFRLRDLTTDDVVFSNTEATTLYCLFGGNTLAECLPRDFEDMNYRWPNQYPIYDGDYEAEIDIELPDTVVTWRFNFVIEDALARDFDEERPFVGEWQTNVGLVVLEQQGDQVSGFYEPYGDPQPRSMQGTIDGRVLEGAYAGDGGGTFRFELSEDGQSFDGTWQGQYHWCGVRTGPLRPGCGYSGSWETIGDYDPDYQPTMQLVQTGAQITGSFRNGLSQMPGEIEGQVGTEGLGSQLTATGVWTIGGNSGAFRWRLVNLNSDRFRGHSVTADGQEHQWCGWRPGLSAPEPCFE